MKLPLKAQIVKPAQRIPRYELLLKVGHILLLPVKFPSIITVTKQQTNDVNDKHNCNYEITITVIKTKKNRINEEKKCDLVS